jgi:hypothetical protein
MDIQEMHDWFDLVWDKYDSLYFTDDEKDSFINRGMLDYVNELAFGRDKQGQGVVVQSMAEMSAHWDHILYPLIDKNVIIASSSNGTLPISDILSAITGNKLISILSVRKNNGGDGVKYVRQNDYSKFQKNYFKVASTEYQQYFITSVGLEIQPVPTQGTNYRLTVLREPAEVDLSTGADCELPSFTHNKIVAKALAISGIPAENEAMAVLDQITD